MKPLPMELAPRDKTPILAMHDEVHGRTVQWLFHDWRDGADVGWDEKYFVGFWPLTCLTCEPPKEGHILVACEYGPAVCYWSDAQGDWVDIATDLVVAFTKWYPIPE